MITAICMTLLLISKNCLRSTIHQKIVQAESATRCLRLHHHRFRSQLYYLVRGSIREAYVIICDRTPLFAARSHLSECVSGNHGAIHSKREIKFNQTGISNVQLDITVTTQTKPAKLSTPARSTRRTHFLPGLRRLAKLTRLCTTASVAKPQKIAALPPRALGDGDCNVRDLPMCGSEPRPVPCPLHAHDAGSAQARPS